LTSGIFRTSCNTAGGATPSRDDWRPLFLEEVRKQHIQRVLAMCKGNRLRAAQVMGIGRTSLYRYLKEDGYDQNVIARAKAAGSGARGLASRVRNRCITFQSSRRFF